MSTTVRAMCAAMGKQPIVMRKFVPGYIANRLQSAIGLEVQQLLDDGEEQEEGVFLLHEDQHHARHEVERLAVADLAVVQCKGLQHTSQRSETLVRAAEVHVLGKGTVAKKESIKEVEATMCEYMCMRVGERESEKQG